jgi:hypothetical protein
MSRRSSCLKSALNWSASTYVPRRNVMVVVFDAPKMAVPGTVAGVQLVAVSNPPDPEFRSEVAFCA